MNKKTIFLYLFPTLILAMEAPISKKQPFIKPDIFKLVSKDNKEFVLPIEHAKQSQTLKNLLKDLKEADQQYLISLDRFSSKTIEEITTLLASLYHHNNLTGKALLDKLEQEIKISDPIQLLVASNYLDIPPLIALASRIIAYKAAHAFSWQPAFKIQVTAIEERELLKAIFHQYYLLTGQKTQGLPASTYTLTQQEQIDYPPNSRITPLIDVESPLAILSGLFVIGYIATKVDDYAKKASPKPQATPQKQLRPRL